MKWHELQSEPCSVAKTLSVIGERWTILILREAFQKITRFDAFEAKLKIPRAVLAERLKALVANGVMEKRPDPNHARHFDYVLTEKGRDLRPVLLTMVAWGDQYMNDNPTMFVHHHSCGKDITPVLYCPDCDEALEPGNFKVSKTKSA